MIALTLPGIEVGPWQVRSKRDRAALALFDRHYSRQKPGRGEVGPPGRKLVLVTPCERAVWCTHHPHADKTLDGLDAYRCSVFRNEGAGLASDLIREAMALTCDLWGAPPADGWVTWIDTRKVASANPGYCFKLAGWELDREWSHRFLVRLRSRVADPCAPPQASPLAPSTRPHEREPGERKARPLGATARKGTCAGCGRRAIEGVGYCRPCLRAALPATSWRSNSVASPAGGE